MGAKVTIKDVAELAGVSKSTVSRYLNHGYISLEKQQRVRDAENIEILFEHNATGLYGENGVEGMHVVKRKGEADEEHYDVAIDGFFLAIGHKPATDIFKDSLSLDEMGYIKTVGNTQQVCDKNGNILPGVFAAGDVCDPIYRQAIVAAGTGCKAALEAEKYVQTI